MEKYIGADSQATYCGVALAILAGILLCYPLFLKNSKAPPRWPLVGMLPSLILHLHHPYDWATEVLIEQGGTFKFKVPGISKVAVSHPANFEYLLKNRFHNFVKGDYFRQIFGDLFGDGSMFVIDGEPWRRMRKTVSSIFVSAGFRADTVRTTIMLVHTRLLPLLESASQNASPVELQDVLHRFTTDGICIASLGVDPISLAAHLPRVPFVEAYKRAVEICSFRMLKPALWWKLLKYLNVGTEQRLRENIKIIDEYIAEAVSLKRKELPTICPDDLPIFFQLEKESGRMYCEREIREFSLSFILAGRDTTSVALQWFFWLVDRHPHVEANILLEIQRILKRRSRILADEEEHNNPSAFTLEEIKEMHYLQAALSESLRLYPPVPFQMSEAVEDDTLPDGTKVEKGWNVMYSFYSTARMESVWGSDCRQFKPERWLSDHNRFTNETEFKFPVFNGGPRRCPGRELAYWQLKWVAASVMVRYRVTTVSGHPVVPELGMALTMKHGLLVKFFTCLDWCSVGVFALWENPLTTVLHLGGFYRVKCNRPKRLSWFSNASKLWKKCK